ncbi:hypothetical protein [Sciscionella marina]|uniref:hypothetical protein n=1 Tax=Sciscionella marina TaxID=508770 RepID=UPI0003737A2D|nr:hypothetical protein [Sciscionella marina]
MTDIRVRRTGVPAQYEIAEGGDTLTRVSARTAQHGGELEIGGKTYRLENSAFGWDCRLHTTDGNVIASAERAGLRSWNITAAGRQLRITRAGIGARNLELTEDTDQIGKVRRVSRGAEAHLPGLDRPAAVFIVIVALAMWQRRRRAAVIGR